MRQDSLRRVTSINGEIKFSVIIPTYNSEKFIEKNFEYILNQTYKNIEVIFCDDGSTDGTLAVLKKLEEHPFVRVFANAENRGPATARNLGLSRAEGDYVLFLDSDDRCKPDLFERLAAINEDIVFFGYEELNENGEKISRYIDKFSYISAPVKGEEAALKKAVKEIWICNCNAVYSRRMLTQKNIRYPDGLYLGEDANFIYKALLNSDKVACLPYEGVSIISRGGSVTHSTFNEKHMTLLSAMDDLIDYTYEHFPESKLLLHFEAQKISAVMGLAARMAQSFGLAAAARLMKRRLPKIKAAKEAKKLLSKKDAACLRLYRCKLLFAAAAKIYKRRGAK